MSLYSTPLKTTPGVRRNTEDNNIPLSRKNLKSGSNPFLASKTGPSHTNMTLAGKITKPATAGTHSGTAASRLTSTKFFNPQSLSMMRVPYGNMFGMVASGRSENIEIKNMAEQSPLELASQYIESLQELDNSSPILDMNSYYSNGVEYNFSEEIGGLGPLTPFERVKVLNIPDELLQKFNESSIKKPTTTQCGIFPEIDRCWFTIGNKLVLWSVKQPNVFQTLDDDFEHDIVKVALAKPHKNTFIHTIEHLLIVATHKDMHVLAISYDDNSEDLKVFNTGLSVPLNGLLVNEIVSNSKTGQIFFTATNDYNVWEFQYSNNDDWFNSKCSKNCLTQSFLSHLIPTGFVSKISSFFGTDHNLEHITKLVIDESRGILYTLSSKNVIKGYGLNKNNKGIDYTIVTNSHDISTKLRMNNNWRSRLFFNELFKIVNIVPVSRKENNSLCLVAITVTGCRIYFTGNQGYSSASLYSNVNNNENVRFTSLTIESVKFPPVTSEQVAKEMNRDVSERGRLMLSNNVYSSFDWWNYKLQRESKTLLSTSTNATIISPGIFFAPVLRKSSKKNEKVSHKLYCSVPDYGILKNYSRYTENATFLDTTGDIKCVTPVTQLFNATETPYGYANEFSTQYTREPLQIAVLTSTNLEIYKYRTPDEVFETFVESGNVEPFVMNNGQAEACSTALFFACKLNKSEQSRISALNFFLLGIPNVIELRPTYNTRMAAPSSGPAIAGSSTTKPSVTGHLGSGSSAGGVHGTLHNELSLDNVILSPRFYGIALLISRLCRDIWSKPIFELMGNIKIVDGKIVQLSTDSSDDSTLNSANANFDAKNDGKQLISKISVSKDELEYYISSIIVLEEFLNKYHDQIICTKATSSPATSSTAVGGSSAVSGGHLTKQEEIAYQAENIGINSLIMLIKSIKEALSFLNVLYEESEINGFEGQYLAFKDIIKYLKLDVQLKLSELKFRDFFTGSNSLEVKTLIREVSSSIINRNLLRGRSIDYITNALQERCGSFCSSNDVLGYRAVEHMKKAREVGLRDVEVLDYHLKNATIYFTKICDDISLDKIKEACWIMLDLNYYPKAIEFLLKMCHSVDKGNLALQYVNDGRLEHDERKKYYDHRMVIYDLIFQILIRLDNEKIITRDGGNSASTISKTPLRGSQLKEVQSKSFSTIPSLGALEKLRKETYHIVFQNDDKLFHYSLYDWLFEQHQQDKLMEIDTPFILPYLKEHSVDSLEACNMLWIYQSKRSRFYESALILLSLATSNFDIELTKRIEYLSRANGFSKSMCSPNERSKMIKLSSDIKEIFEVAEIQDEILKMVENDSRLKAESDSKKVGKPGKNKVTVQSKMVSQLNNKILSVSDLFNDYAEPLEYYEICLLIFQISDFRVREEIIKKWKQLFVSIQQTQQNDSNSNDLKYLLSNLMVSLGKKLYTNDFVFPVGELIQLIVEFFYNGNADGKSADQQISYKTGEIIDMFINCGVPYDKLYYILKNLIETNNFVITIYKKEMIYLIKNWYKEDRNLRDIIKYEQIRSLPEVYELSKDPINEYTEKTGDRI
ncbi:hypothetical protein ACO0QE_004237 [Hanseniaspora vineae]